MNSRLVLFAICLSFALPSTTVAKVSPWIEVRSPHFRVLTNGSAADARRVAHEFEQMRYVFASRFAGLRLDSGAPMSIFAARDENTAKSLEPAIWKRKGAKPAGLFKHGWEKQYVMVDLDRETTGLNTYALVYHEYTHSILHMNAHWLPTWLDEGLAEFYGYTRFESHKILLGAPTDRHFDQERPLIPLKTLLEVTPRSPYYHDADKANLFYFESWALVHYLTFGSGMGNGEKLSQFFRELQTGTDQEQAFQQVFGSFAEVEKELDESTRLLGVTAAAVPDQSQVEEKTFAVRKLTVAETAAELAGYHLWSHDLTSARPLVKEALAEDPKLGLVHEENGFLLFADGEMGRQRKNFHKPMRSIRLLSFSLCEDDAVADRHVKRSGGRGSVPRCTAAGGNLKRAVCACVCPTGTARGARKRPANCVGAIAQSGRTGTVARRVSSADGPNPAAHGERRPGRPVCPVRGEALERPRP